MKSRVTMIAGEKRQADKQDDGRPAHDGVEEGEADDQQRGRVHDEEGRGGRRIGRSAMRRDGGEGDARRAAEASGEDQEAVGHAAAPEVLRREVAHTVESKVAPQ